jgi:nucleoside-diphosphate-sugar epimerase
MFYKDKKVLVTGGTGFVGTHFVQALLEQGARVVRIPVHKRQPLIKHESIETVSADLNNLADCLKVCEGMDYVIHAADFVGGAGLSTDGVISGIAGNLILTARVLEAGPAADRDRPATPARKTIRSPTDD